MQLSTSFDLPVDLDEAVDGSLPVSLRQGAADIHELAPLAVP